MARLPQQLTLLLACMLICNFFFCQHASGIAFKQPDLEGHKDQDTDTFKYTPVEGNKFLTGNGTSIEMFPVSEPHLQLQAVNNSRRQLGNYLSCSTCKCCDKTLTECSSSMPCCFTIDCNVQPYGYCKYEPVICGCQGCGS